MLQNDMGVSLCILLAHTHETSLKLRGTCLIFLDEEGVAGLEMWLGVIVVMYVSFLYRKRNDEILKYCMKIQGGGKVGDKKKPGKGLPEIFFRFSSGLNNWWGKHSLKRTCKF